VSRLLCFDIETAPIDGAEAYVGAIQAPSNYTNAESIEKYVTLHTSKELDKAALDPDLCRVVCLAYQFQQTTEVKGRVARDEGEERDLLERFWAVVRAEAFKVRYAGYNISGFDLAVLIRRSQFLKVSYPSIRLGRYAYQMPDVLDIQLCMNMDRHEAFKWRSKDWWVRRLKLTGAEDDNKGAQVPALVALGDWDAVLHHCKQDVVKEVQMLEWLGLWS
jgi:hypothetical protein